MRRPTPLRRSPALDLVAFVMVLATGVTLVALGLSPESLAAVTIALAGLYSAWRTGQPPAAPPIEMEVRQEELRSLERGAERRASHLGGEVPARQDVR